MVIIVRNEFIKNVQAPITAEARTEARVEARWSISILLGSAM
jgi:hypothetical protein